MKILYALQGTGNGHVARARDLVPRFAQYGEVDVLLSGKQSEIDLGFPVKYRPFGLSMVYNKHGAVSYWRSLWSNKFLRFVVDVFKLPVQEYDLVVIDFESVASYACLLRGVKALQLSHQAAYLSDLTPRPDRRILHWEWVLKYMSPATFKIGFHFENYDEFILPPIIREEIREMDVIDNGHYTVYLSAYGTEEQVHYLNQFPEERFEVFIKNGEIGSYGNCVVHRADVDLFKESFRTCRGLITGGGFEAPAEAMYMGKKLLISPIKGQYEQACNAACAQNLGVQVFEDLAKANEQVFRDYFRSVTPEKIDWPNYAEDLVAQIIANVNNGQSLDNISSLEVWKNS